MVAPLAFAALALFAPLQQQAPDTGVVRGLVRSATTGERLPFSVIEIVGGARALATLADSAGGYALRGVASGRQMLRVSRFDHAPLEIEVLVPSGRSVTLDVDLVQRPVELPGITATSTARPALADTVNPPTPELSVVTTRALEATPGAIELGLGQVSRGVPGQVPVDPSDVLYVRGAPADMKLVLLDGAPVYAPFHLGGLIQAFDPELLHSAELYLGGAPAKYDGGLSYVLGLETRAGRRTTVHSSGTADLLSTRALVEGPLTGRAGFLAGGRMVHSTGAELLLDRSFPYEYADVLGRLDADVGEGAGIALTGFWNHEAIQLGDGQAAPGVAAWGNRAASLRYRGPLLGADGDLTAAYGGYEARLPLGGPQPAVADGWARRARLAADMSRGTAAARFYYGVSYERIDLHYFVEPRVASGDALLLEAAANGEVLGAYADLDWRPSPQLRIRSGLRADAFTNDATVRYAPRLAVTWTASERAALTIAAGRYRQFIRSTEPVILVDGDSMPSAYVPPPLALARASHLVLGLDQDLGDGLRLGVEGFYKMFDGVPRADTTGIAQGTMATAHTAGARASGVDFWLRRSDGRLTGWLGYSLGWVWSAEESAATDRFAGRQILSIGLAGPLGGTGQFDLRVAYGAGLPYAAIPRVQVDNGAPLLDAKAATAGVAELQSVTINAPPLTAAPDDPYLRVDLEVSHPWKLTWGERPVTFTPYLKVINALDRRDALFYQVGAEGQEPSPLAALPLLPVLGFRWKF